MPQGQFVSYDWLQFDQLQKEQETAVLPASLVLPQTTEATCQQLTTAMPHLRLDAHSHRHATVYTQS